MRQRLTPARIWTMPAGLSALSALGLTAALFSESVGDLIAWVALAMPVGVVVWFWCRQPGRH